jgi:hypothetical protein
MYPRKRTLAYQWGIVFSVSTNKETCMNVTISLAPLISLIAGILILVMPRLLNYIVAIYLIVIGLIGIFGITL